MVQRLQAQHCLPIPAHPGELHSLAKEPQRLPRAVLTALMETPLCHSTVTVFQRLLFFQEITQGTVNTDSVSCSLTSEDQNLAFYLCKYQEIMFTFCELQPLHLLLIVLAHLLLILLCSLTSRE